MRSDRVAAFARELRGELTDAEAILWRHLRDRRLAGLKFRRQAAIGPYIADFVCLEAKLVVEADGGQHADNARDVRRDAFFASQGFRTLRIWNIDIQGNLESVLDTIENAAREKPGAG